MKRTFQIAAIVVLLAGLSLAHYHYITTPCKEGIATLKPARIQLFKFSLSDFSVPVFIDEPSIRAELADFPKELENSDRDIYYFALTVGPHLVYAAIRENEDNSAQMWLDRNLDKRLSDETPLTGGKRTYREGKRIWEYNDFGPIRINKQESAEFRLIFSAGGPYVLIHPVNCMEGKIRLGRQVYRVAVVDGDFDGSFNTLYTPNANYRYAGCDTFIADTSHGLFSRDYDSGRIVPLGRYYRFYKERYGISMPTEASESCYTVELSADGRQLKMQPVNPPTGILKIGSSAQLSTRLLSDAASQSVTIADECILPAGRYQMHHGQLTFTDENNDTHQVYAVFTEDIRKGQFEIKPGQTCTINPGPPFTIQTEIAKGSDHTLGINAGLAGREGETYGLRIVRDMPEPTLRIVDENDKELHAGTMEYG